MKQNKGIIGIGLIIAIVLGIVVVGGGAYYVGMNKGEVKKKVEVKLEDNNVVEEDQVVPVEEKKKDLINDEVLGISFKINSGAVAQKGASRCCPNAWTISDNSGDQDTIEQYVVGSTDDPKLWKVVTNMGTQKLGSNTYSVYKRNDGMFVFTIIKNDKAFMIDSFSNPAKFVDLSSFTINSATKTYTYKNHGFTVEIPQGYVVREDKVDGMPYAIRIGFNKDTKEKFYNYTITYISDVKLRESLKEKISVDIDPYKDYRYIGDEKIGTTTFKVYRFGGPADDTIYSFTQGNVGYEVWNSGKELLETFKFVGWN